MENKVKILVLNCGSSSLTFKVFERDKNNSTKIIFEGKAHGLLESHDSSPYIEFKYKGSNEIKKLKEKSHSFASELLIKKLQEKQIEINYIGHRWIHSAGQFSTAFIDESIMNKLEELIPLFPIHHPAILSVINKCQILLPSTPEYLCVDNSFHSTIPPEAYTYALPIDLLKKFGFRKYGFHGISYQYVTKAACNFLNKKNYGLRIVACHLGTGGSSVAAIKNGRSIDTSMGYTSLTGLVMSTRTGDIDPMLSLYLISNYGYRSDDLMNIFNKKSGLLGISEYSSDIRELIKRNFEDERSKLALNMYIRSLKKYIGSFITALKGIDVLVFTDDIGIHNWYIRKRVCEDMEWCNMKIDSAKNLEAIDNTLTEINSEDSEVKILVAPTEEELEIYNEGLKLIERCGK
jgi:acetate kinase